MLKDELEIIIITYNRKNKLKKTLQTLITENSPIKDFNITILDNASDDGTNELCEAFCKEYTNFKYIRNKYNIGISGNTIRAFELASKKWLWILCDDDKYDWSGWAEIEDALKRDYDIVHTTYTDGVRNETTPYKLNEEIFLPTAIYNTRNIDSTFFQNAYGIAYTLCPSHALNCKIINQKGKIFVPEKKVVIQTYNDKCNLIRAPRKWLYHKLDNFQLLAGYIAAYQLIEDKKIKEECCDVLCMGSSFKDSMRYFLNENNGYLYNIFEVLLGTSKKQQKELISLMFDRGDINCKAFLKQIILWLFMIPPSIVLKKIIKLIFSKKKTDTHKIYKILGIKIKVKRKGLKKVCYWLDSNQAGIIPMRDNHIYACCTRAVPILVDKKYNYDELTYDDIQKNRIKLYKDINSGKAPQCEGCDCLIKKPAKKIDIGKISYLIYHPHTTCNLQCCYCFFQKNEQYAKLDPRTADLYAAVKNFHKIGLFKENIQLELGGGEPLLLNNIDKTYEFMAENYPKGGIVLVSNYALSKRVETIIPVFKQRKIKTVLKTSIDCGTRETYAKIRNRDVFEDVVNNITRSAKEGIFDAIYLKYILLEDGSNTSDKDIYGFIDICRQVAAQNPYKTSVIIDADMRAISEDGNEYFKTKEGEFTTFKPHLIKDDMLRAAGMIYKAVTDDLGLDVIWTGDRLSAVSKEGLEDIERIKEYANNIKDKRN